MKEEIEQKDKVIKLMTKRVLITEKEIEEIQKKNIDNIDAVKKDFFEQIKQYFENKAKEVK